MTQITEEKRWTYENYLHLTDGKRYEIVGGRLSMMVPAPEFNHQRIAMTLAVKFYLFVEKHGLGYVVDAPTDVILDEENVVQPDILFISRENKDVIRKNGVFGPPDLVVEIVSPSTQYRDVYEKKDLYARFRVKEYWIVNPYTRRIEVLSLNEQGIYILFSEGYMDEGGNRVIKSAVLKDFTLDLGEVFREDFEGE
ncbi:MAG: Uma2 family endonuclease [Candidatus Brocadia sp. WS118]|nr:MAG: Uma2 family endonuclease [Candidatus Brocadia sp. WS118]